MIRTLTMLVLLGLAVGSARAELDTETADTSNIYKMPSVTVSSTKADNKTPVPFVEIKKSEIEENYSTQDIPSLLSGQPSVIFYSENGNAVGYSNLTMRGFNQRRISVMINGIPQNDPEDHNVYWIDFPDLASNLESIEIQRGAGLMNYGSAAIGGSINLTTSNYLKEKALIITFGGGWQQFDDKLKLNINKESVQFSSGLIDDKYSFYGRLSRIWSGGYRDRSWAELQSYFFSGARFDENVTTQLNVFGGPLRDGLAYTGLPKYYNDDYELRRQNLGWWAYDSTGENISYALQRDEREKERFSQPHFELLNDITISENVQMLSSLFYYQGDGYFDYNGDWADTTMLRITYDQGFSPKQNPTNTLIRAWVNNKQGGWIPRFVIKHNSGELLVGGELRFHRSWHYANINFANGLPDDYDQDYRIYSYRGIRDIYSAYVREQFDINDRLMLYGEVQMTSQRYAIDEEKAGNHYTEYKTVDGGTVGNGDKIFDLRYFFVNPRLGANYALNENHKLYGFAAITNREPRMRNIYAADDSYFGATPLFEGTVSEDGSVAYDFTKPLTKPEQMLDIELGYTFASAHLYFNANFYFMDYKNELVKSGQIDIFGSPVTGNAPKTRHLGLELTAQYNGLTTDFGTFDFAGNLTLSRNKIIEYEWITSGDDQGNVKKISLEDNDIAGFPSLMGNISINYNVGGFNFLLAYMNVGEFRTDNFGELLGTSAELKEYLGSGYYRDNILDAYNVFNARLSYKFDNPFSLQWITVKAQINNIFNTLYNAGGEGKHFFPAAERNFYLGIELGI